jgi:hypothetical protein
LCYSNSSWWGFCCTAKQSRPSQKVHRVNDRSIALIIHGHFSWGPNLWRCLLVCNHALLSIFGVPTWRFSLDPRVYVPCMGYIIIFLWLAAKYINRDRFIDFRLLCKVAAATVARWVQLPSCVGLVLTSAYPACFHRHDVFSIFPLRRRWKRALLHLWTAKRMVERSGFQLVFSFSWGWGFLGD